MSQKNILLVETPQNLDLVLKSGENMHLVIYFIDKIGTFDATVRLLPNSSLQIQQIILGGKMTCKFNFHIEESAILDQQVAFKLTNKDQLNFHYLAEHFGANSNSNVRLVGGLDDSAKKQSELKIHFNRGATGAIGAEREKVSIFSNEAQNIASPIILSDESEARGYHGFSSGFLADDEREYLLARGLSAEQIKHAQINGEILKLAKQAKITKIVEGLL